jgi:hypothetical protein
MNTGSASTSRCSTTGTDSGWLWQALARLLEPERLHVLTGSLGTEPQTHSTRVTIEGLLADLDACAAELRGAADRPARAPSDELRSSLKKLSGWLARIAKADMPERLLSEMWHGQRDRCGLGSVLLAWLLLHDLGRQVELENDRQCLDLLCRFGLDFAWRESAATPAQALDVSLGMLLMQTSAGSARPASNDPAFYELVEDPQNADLLGINRHAGQRWFSREGMAALAGAVALQAALVPLASPPDVATPEGATSMISERLRERLARAAAVGYRLDKFVQLG